MLQWKTKTNSSTFDSSARRCSLRDATSESSRFFPFVSSLIRSPSCDCCSRRCWSWLSNSKHCCSIQFLRKKRVYHMSHLDLLRSFVICSPEDVCSCENWILSWLESCSCFRKHSSNLTLTVSFNVKNSSAVRSTDNGLADAIGSISRLY